eukprot:12931984-Ditylum_brightwellii.AAC.1
MMSKKAISSLMTPLYTLFQPQKRYAPTQQFDPVNQEVQSVKPEPAIETVNLASVAQSYVP